MNQFKRSQHLAKGQINNKICFVNGFFGEKAIKNHQHPILKNIRGRYSELNFK